jgi:hypothetical protein
MNFNLELTRTHIANNFKRLCIKKSNQAFYQRLAIEKYRNASISMRYLLQKVLAGQPSDFYDSTKENNVTQSNKIMKNYDQCTASKQRTLIHLQYKRHEEKCHHITFKQLLVRY